jgi:lysophospholipid acyltransferase (LPLAT)-like uncharacterized protein
MSSRSFTSRYLVDDVPLVLRPFHDAFSYTFGFLLFAYARLAYITSRIEFIGRERAEESSNHIFCGWHLFSPLVCTLFYRARNHIWMQHPGWFNKHMHVVVRLYRVKVVMGSTGFGGRAAADAITELLRKGHSTVAFPDAPRGPRCVLKDGVLHMSRKSGVPIVAIRCRMSSFVELKGWDRKRIPLPFGRIRVEFKEPIQVTEENFDEAREQLIEALGVPEE